MVRIQVLTAESIKMTIFWDLASTDVSEVLAHHPDDGGSKHF
jgi:hypothetical protein